MKVTNYGVNHPHAKVRGWVAGNAAVGTATLSTLGLNVLTPTTITSNTDNWNPTGLATGDKLRVSTDAPRTITGIVAPSVNRLLLLDNVGAFDITLAHDTTSTAANRFLCPNDVDFTVPPEAAVWLQYDTASSRWRIASGGGGGGASSIYLNVMDYGATGNGSTDDTAAIQAAINASIEGETVFFPTGTYKITTTLDIPHMVRLLGAGADPNWYNSSSVINMATSNTTAISCTAAAGGADLGVENLTIIGPGSASSGRGIYSASSVRLRAVHIEGFYDGIYVDDSLGIPPSTAFYNHIEHCWLMGNARAGIWLHDGVNNTSVIETYHAANQYGLVADGGGYGLRIQNCSFEVNSVTGIDIDGTGSAQSQSSVHISGCYFESLLSGGSTTADITIGPGTTVYGVLIEGCFFVQSDITTLWHVILNHADGVTLAGNFFGKNAELGAITSDASNTTNVLLLNNTLNGSSVVTPSTTRILDETDVTPASTAGANAVGTSKYLARADHVHQSSGGSSPLTTKGDIYTYTTTNDRVGVGANGTRPRADSAEAAGWAWSALIWRPVTTYDPTTGLWVPLVDGSGNAIMAEA